MTKLSAGSLVHETAIVKNTRLGRFTEVAERCRLEECVLGDYSYMMEDCGAWCAEICKFANIAASVRINATNHPMHRASQHHFTYRANDYWPDATAEEAFFDWRREHAVSIGNDVWIGHGSIILPGVSIGDGAVIGAGSVVTRDVAPYQIFAGNPARLIRERFSPGVSERLQSLAWWNWSHEKLRQTLPDFRDLDIEAFLEKHGA